jgi:hypothetical protein
LRFGFMRQAHPQLYIWRAHQYIFLLYHICLFLSMRTW